MALTVCVLLSTYNGESHLKEQIDSILNQQGLDIKLLIRDDGSQDSTISIIKEYESSDKRVETIVGNNIGFANSFFELLKSAPDADYYAFSDQDDVWLKKKLINTVSCFENDSILLAFCNAYITDSKLNPIKPLYGEGFLVKNKYTCFDDTIAHGCLIVISKKARQLILKYRGQIPVSHDTWICGLCSFLGNIGYNPETLSFYRRHDLATTFYDDRRSILERIKYIINNDMPTKKCALIIIDYYKDLLSQSDLDYLSHVAHYDESIKDKMWLLFSKKTIRNSFLSTLKLKIKIMINRF